MVCGMEHSSRYCLLARRGWVKFSYVATTNIVNMFIYLHLYRGSIHIHVHSYVYTATCMSIFKVYRKRHENIFIPTLLKKPWKNAPLSVNFVYAWKNYPSSTKLTLFWRDISIHRWKTILPLQQCISHWVRDNNLHLSINKWQYFPMIISRSRRCFEQQRRYFDRATTR
jgi:hypothetical protein